MLPEFLASSYRRYKEDTALFTTWLAKAAASSGYKPKTTKRRDFVEAGPPKPVATANGSETAKILASVTNNAPGRLKGKDRKIAKNAADGIKKPTDEYNEAPTPTTVKYTITTEELLRQAAAVSEAHIKSRVEMPASLRSVVQRAIRARQRCSQWFQRSGVQNQHADKQHLHFIGVLEKSLKILEPCMEMDGTMPNLQKQDETSQEMTASVGNRFTALQVEESPDVDPFEVTEVAAAINVAGNTKTSKGKPEVAVYELEEEDQFDEDLAFIIFCFFEDLHRTQAFIGELWGKYKARKCDLHTAAVTTNAAFDLVRQAEEDILARAPKFFNRKRSWDSIAIIIFYADAFQQGICPEARLNSKDSLRITPFDDFIYLSTARILMKFTYLSDIPADCGLEYPIPCPPLRFGYISRPDLLGTPEMDKREQEDLFLSRVVMDRHLWNTYKGIEHEGRTPPPPEDELSQSLDRLMKEGVLSVALVFEARVFLDIQDIMGNEINRGYQDLLQITGSIDKIMNLRVVDGAWDVGGTGERWHEKDVDIVMRIKETSMNWVLENPTNAFPKLKEMCLSRHTPEDEVFHRVPGLDAKPQFEYPSHVPSGATSTNLSANKMRPPRDPKFSTVSMSVHRVPDGVDPRDPEFKLFLEREMVESDGLPNGGPTNLEYEENARKMNIKNIQPSTDLNFLRLTNPIYCGMVSFSMITDFEAAGIALCNWHQSIWPTAHLYNAIQRTTNTSKAWPEMEELIDLHMGALFAGQLPLSAYEIFVRYALALGLPMSYFSRNPRNRTNNDRMRSRQETSGTKLEVTKISSIFRHYFERKTSLETCLVKLDEVLRKPGPRATRKEKDAWSRPLTTLQFLSMLEAKLPRISQRLQFDYITLTKQSGNLLKKIRLQIGLELQVSYPLISSEDTADQTLAWVVMLILEENNEVVSAVENSARRAPAPTIGPQLAVAGQEMQKFLSTYRPQDLISNFNALPRPTHTSSGICPNHWNISIRHIPLNPPGDLVYFVQPNSYYVHTEGPIQTAEGQPSGHVLNPKSLLTLQTIARLIMKAFTEGMGANMTLAPWSWTTNDSNFARRIIKVMTDMGVRQELMNMQVAAADELRICNESWDNMRQQVTGIFNRS